MALLTHPALFVNRKTAMLPGIVGSVSYFTDISIFEAIDEKLGVAADAVVVDAAEGNDGGILATVAALPQSVRIDLTMVADDGLWCSVKRAMVSI